VDVGLNVQRMRRTRAFPGQPAILILSLAVIGTQWDFQVGAHFWTAILMLTIALLSIAAGPKRRAGCRRPAPQPPRPIQSSLWRWIRQLGSTGDTMKQPSGAHLKGACLSKTPCKILD